MRDRREIRTDRRGFIREVGMAVLTVQLLPAIARAAEGSAGAGAARGGNLVIRSGQGFVPHTHDLSIPYAILRAPPPEGVKLTSTMARGHTHEVALSHDELAAVNRGGTVTLKGGSHSFVIALALGIADPTSQSQGGAA